MAKQIMTNKTKMNEIEFVRNNRIVKELILVDGAPRSGKSMIGAILATFDRVEIERMEPILDSLPILYYFNKIEKDAAIALLCREIDNKLYDSLISRNVNFRFSDRTGVINNVSLLKYFKRLFYNDGDIVLERIKRERPIFQVQTHDMLQKIDLYFDAFQEGLRVIEMVRHPVDLVDAMYNRGIGDRIGIDPRAWQLSIKCEGGEAPYYAFGWTNDFLKESPLNRVIKVANSLTEQVTTKYESLSHAQKKQVLFVPFEEFAVSPSKCLELISKFIDAKITKRTYRSLRRQKVPRKIDIKEREKKVTLLKENASEENILILNNLVKKYEKKYLNGI